MSLNFILLYCKLQQQDSIVLFINLAKIVGTKNYRKLDK